MSYPSAIIVKNIDETLMTGNYSKEKKRDGSISIGEFSRRRDSRATFHNEVFLVCDNFFNIVPPIFFIFKKKKKKKG